MVRSRAFLTLAAIGLTAGCASSTDFERADPSPRSRVIGHDEIQDTKSASNAMQMVQTLRPDWLRPKVETIRSSTILPVVFVDNRRVGPLESLEQIYVNDIEEIRYFAPSAATTKWGSGVMGGAIEVVRFPPIDRSGIQLAATDTGLDGAFVLSDCVETFQRTFPDRMKANPPVLASQLEGPRPERLEGPELGYPEAELYEGRMSGWANIAFVIETDSSVVDGALISTSQEAFAVEAGVWLLGSKWQPGLLSAVPVPTLMCERIDFKIGR